MAQKNDSLPLLWQKEEVMKLTKQKMVKRHKRKVGKKTVVVRGHLRVKRTDIKKKGRGR